MRLRTLALAMMLAGCSGAPAPAAVPECDVVQISYAETPQGLIYMMDDANLTMLLERGHAIQEGRCRMPPRQPKAAPGVAS